MPFSLGSVSRLAVVSVAGTLLASCGGGGGDSGSAAGSGATALPASSTLAAQCAVPRPAATVDPISGRPYADVAGSLATEQAFLRSWIDETYLWYSDVRALPASTLNAAAYATPLAFFDALKTPLNDASGQPKDKFHFTYATKVWDDLSLSDVSYGYGFELALVARQPPRSTIVAYASTAPGTPAAANNIRRGAAILTVDGVDVANGADVSTLNAGLFPTAAGVHTLVIRDPGASTTRTVTLNAQQITNDPVPNVQALSVAGARVGYILFNDHTATSESKLVNAITQLKASNVTDLVLDIRYNGGGYLDIAAELAYMIAGPTLTNGKFFERENYNDRNPFNLSVAQATTGFLATGQGLSVSRGVALPTLSLSRVYVLTTADTCSASEAIVNGLRGAGVTVNLIGGQTCGKPYGFIPRDNCGTTYFAIQFQGVNNLGFGDYPDGFAPACSVADDFAHALGDPAEGVLNVALGLRSSGLCTPLSGEGAHTLSADRSSGLAGRQAPVLVRNPFRENRILRAGS